MSKLHSHFQSKPFPKLRPANPRLSEDGSTEILDSVSETISREFQPPTLSAQINKLNRLGQIARYGAPLFTDDTFTDDDDFHDDYDDIPFEGLSPYEVAGMGLKPEKKPTEKKKPSSATTPATAAAPVTEQPSTEE